jgi:outer membrane protein assembly factor BamE (lipoprotein component of BamABCDE complex)
MMKYLLLLLIPVMAFSIGCGMPYKVGTPVDKAKVDQIIPGTTSEDKVVEMLGQPAKKETVGEDQTKYVYN